MRLVVRLGVLAAVLGALAAAQMSMTASALRGFLRSSLQLKHPDRQVAEYVKKIRLTERFTMRDVEELQGEGLGPRTLEALRELVAATAGLPQAAKEPAKPPSAVIPPPPAEEQQRIIDEAREISLNYSKRLPDFICLQVTRRYYDPSGTESFMKADTVASKLTYFEQKEDYKVVSVDGRLVDTSMERVGGATSTGEFGSMLREIFEPGTQAEFWWERWATLRGRRTHVYGYRVKQANSKWHISWQRTLDIVPAYSGWIYIDRDAPTVMRVTLKADNMPPSFPIQEAQTILDYSYSSVGEQEYLLPLKSEMRMREGKLLVRNDTEFHNYRKFGAEATITFIPEPLDEEKTKEKPPIK